MGGYVVLPSKHLIFRISHDEFIDAYAKDEALLSEVQSQLGEIMQPSNDDD